MKQLLLTICILLLVKLSLQDCCYTETVKGDGQSLYYVDIIVKPPSDKITISYIEDYNTVEAGATCAKTDLDKKYVCTGDPNSEYFSTRFKMNEASGQIINTVTLDVRSGNNRCQKSFDTCNADGTIDVVNGDNFCLGFLGCFPKMACYIAIGVLIVCIAGIVIVIFRRNSGSGEMAALDRPNTKVNHLENDNHKRESFFNFNRFRGSQSNTAGSPNKETLIQFDDIPIESKEAGKTIWKKKDPSSQPPVITKNIGSGLGSGGFGSSSTSLLPTSSVVKVHSDGTGTGLNHARSVKRAPSKRVNRSQSTKKTANRHHNDNTPPLPTSYDDLINTHQKSTDHVINMSPQTYKANVNRTKSTRSTKSVKKPRAYGNDLSTGLNSNDLQRSKSRSSTRHKPSRYQMQMDSDSDSDSDNEILGLRTKPSIKKLNNSSPKANATGLSSSRSVRKGSTTPQQKAYNSMKSKISQQQ